MRHDIQNQVMVAQVLTVTAVSANSYKLGAAGLDPSIGRRMAMLVMPTVDAGGTVTATSYEFQAVQADNTALTTNLEVLGSVVVTGANTQAGSQIEIPIPQGSITRQFLGVKVIPTGGTAPTVTLDAYYVPQDEIPKNKFFTKVEEAKLV